MRRSAAVTVWTVGHSTRSWEEFLVLMREHDIEVLADVRRFPSSQRVPWANRSALEENLRALGVRYEHLADLGGYRKPRADSMNTGWRQGGFRGYADHMETEAFQEALGRLLDLAKERRTAVMCAEALPWRCHRGLLADALVARGARVVHILGPGQAQEHRLTSFAKVHAGRVSYPGRGGKAFNRGRP